MTGESKYLLEYITIANYKKQYKGGQEKPFYRFRPLRGYPPPTPPYTDVFSTKKVYGLGGGYPPPTPFTDICKKNCPPKSPFFT